MKKMMRIIYVFSILISIFSLFICLGTSNKTGEEIEKDNVINTMYDSLVDSAYMYVNENDSMALSYLLKAFDEKFAQNPYYLYDAAALSARLKQKDQSFNLLGLAVENGYSFYDHMKNNKNFPELDSSQFHYYLEKVRLRDSLLLRITTSFDSIFDLDQNIRDRYHNEIILKQVDVNSIEARSILDSMKVIDDKNLIYVNKIADEYGFLGRCLKSEKSKNVMYVIYLHAPIEEIENKMEMIKEAVRSGELPRQQYPYFADRVLSYQKGVQQYGTQYTIRHGKVVFVPFMDSLKVDEYRQKFGLSPIDSYVKLIEKDYK